MRDVKRTPVRTFTTSGGQSFAVRVLPTGARYGRTNALTCDHPTVEFYDTAYADDGRPGGQGFGPLGQFVSRYYVDTLLGHDGHGGGSGGIDLYGGVREWEVDADTMTQIRTWLNAIEVQRVPRLKVRQWFVDVNTHTDNDETE